MQKPVSEVFCFKVSRHTAPHLRARDELDARFRSLEAVYAGDPASTKRLSELKTVSDAKMAKLQKTIDLKTAGDDRGALQLVGSDLGLRLMQQARAIVAELREGNVQRMTARQGRARQAGRLVEISVLLAIMAAMGSLALF